MIYCAQSKVKWGRGEVPIVTPLVKNIWTYYTLKITHKKQDCGGVLTLSLSLSLSLAVCVCVQQEGSTIILGG